MEKPYDKEYIKMAMLKHEETFKQQVYELHRLYRIQKLLMKSIENGSPKSRETHERWDYRSGIIKSNQINDQHHQDKPAKEHIAESYGEIALEIEDESEIQLTLGPTSYYRRKKFAETPRASDSGSSLSSSSTGSSNQEFWKLEERKVLMWKNN